MSSLKEQFLWFSDIEKMNDPFEGMYVFENDLTENQIKKLTPFFHQDPAQKVGNEKFKNMLLELGLEDGKFNFEELVNAVLEHDLKKLIRVVHNSKVLCLTLSNEDEDPLLENLMWSHYADGLRGYCLVFDTEELITDLNSKSPHSIKPINIKYQNKPNKLSLSKFLDTGILMGSENYEYVDEVSETIATKSTSWSYEKEIRFLSLDSNEKVQYSKDTLKEVVIGCKMPLNEQQNIISICKNVNPKVLIKKAQLKDSSYELEVVDY
ncbi:DUF2971 domain-containing protein [Thalassotalea crassostreae]|uniref:DUF2971 domain-containing protein n=1 Tax=Thalassotalea crassostreae TaxID=1763536 RepID=UPI0012FE1703|nr:DUF2971 domain-containing protein [Thalassotalea crassostreae]